MKKYVKMQFNADLKNIVFARGVVSCFFVDEGYDINCINEVKTVVSEAVTNAIIHGYKEDNSKLVTLILELNNDQVKVSVIDEGVGIENINIAKEPLYSTLKNDERAGIGFTVMEVFSDIFDCISEVGVGTTIISIKNLN